MYTGTDSPNGTIPQGSILWSSDYMVPAGGWKICPTMVMETEAAPENNTVFSVDAGLCQVTAAGCVKSPNISGSYSNSKSCVIRVDTDTAGPLTVPSFDTEVDFDMLVVNGMRFSGSNATKDLLEGIVPFEDIVWYSDGMFQGGGWEICSSEKVPLETEIEPVSVFTVTSGNCTIDTEGCASSPHFPDAYQFNETCTIGVHPFNTLPILVVEFKTEAHYDNLEVNGVNYSHISAPWGVVPHDNIKWVSDGTAAGPGWKICLQTNPNAGIHEDSSGRHSACPLPLALATAAIFTWFAWK
jgi:hypothetical protein